MNNAAEKIEPEYRLVEATTPIHPVLWEQVKPFIQMGLDKSSSVDWLMDDVKHFVNSGRGILLIGLRDTKPFLACVYEIEEYYRRKVMNVYLIGAEPHSDWEPFMDALIEQARRIGCSEFKGAGRKGWARLLKRYGETKLVYEWELKL